MKKLLFLCAALVCAAVLSSAQESRRFGLGFGFEGNMNTRVAVAAGGSLAALFGVNNRLSLGLKGTFSHNFDRIMVVEPEALIRWYVLPLGRGAFFLQGGGGTSLVFEDEILFPAFLGSLTAGARIPVGSLRIEPYIRGGYPFVWGVGFSLVFLFGRAD